MDSERLSNQAPNTRYPRPKTLITGGAGFLGSHLCDRLIAEGHEVICLDNLITGSLQNIKHLIDHPRFTFIQHDVTQPIDLDALLATAQHLRPNTQDLHYVLHFASPASPRDYIQHPIHTLKVGALGTYHVLGLAKAKGAVFLLASSSEVYGDPEVNPQPESYWGHVNPVGPRSVYDEAKRYADAITMAYHRVHNISTRIARIFNTFGSRMRIDDGRVLPNFTMQALRGEPLTVYGDGSQTRSFCYVDDLIEGIYRLLLWQSPSPTPGTQHPRPNTQDLIPVFNLGNPDEITILAFAHKILEITGSKSSIVYRSLPEDDPKVRRPDITKAKKILNWQPKVALDEGLRRTIEWFKSKL